MKRTHAYLLLAVIGAVAPYVFFVPFFAEHGISGKFVPSLFVNDAAGGITVDLLVSSLVFWVFLVVEGRRAGVGRSWVFVLINLLIGLSCALPLFLWARERVAERASLPRSTAGGPTAASVSSA